jgi:hypothetical protein
MRKPRLFIASSAESLPVAEAVNVNLDHEFEVTIWKNGTFKLSSTVIEDLVEKSSAVDFALFIFTPDDIATIRSRKEHVVRDNVVFEMGLFVGAIGKNRSFFLKPRDTEIHLPTDLLGVTAADYDANRSDGDLVSATNKACALIKAEVDRLGLINFAAVSANQVIRANPKTYEIVREDARVLSACLQSYTNLPEGLGFDRISSSLRKIEDQVIQLSLIKLERMEYITKAIETNHEYGFDYYAYKITESGIDFLLSSNLIASAPSAPPQPKGFDSFDDDVPF